MSTATPTRPAWSTRARAALSRREWTSIAGMALFVAALHVVGWGVLVGVVAPRALPGRLDQVFGVGLGVTAYTLGMRHAFDADHIAAIDNTTRKLMAEGKRPLSVGFWFSLGHSSRRVRAVPAARVRRAGPGRPGRERRVRRCSRPRA